MNKQYLLGIFLILFFSFKTEKDNYNNVKSSQIDLSPDDSSILISYSINNTSSIYEFSLDGEQKAKLTSASQGENHIMPRYSPNGDKILFILFSDKNNKVSGLCLMNRDGSNMKKLTTDNLLITEAIFHPDGDKIFFCASGYFGHYSPIGVNQPHEINIYSIKIDGTGLKKLADYHNYSLSGLNFLSDSTLIYKVVDKDRDGFFTQRLFKPWKSEHIVVKDNPNPEAGGWFYCAPAVSHNKRKLAFTAPYELYIMDLETKAWEKLYRPEPILCNMYSIHFFQSDERIIFTKNNYEQNANSSGNDYDIMVMDLTTKETKRIELKLK